MKFRTTKKEMIANYKCYSIGYADLQYLFTYIDPVAYTCGVYGWNSNIYTFGTVAIVTGYRPFGAHVEYDLIREYNMAAKEILENENIPLEDVKTLLNNMIKDFLGDIQK